MANVLSGSTIGKSMQVNVDILGGIQYSANTGSFKGLPTKASLATADEQKQYLSSSFGSDTGTIIQALNHLKAQSSAVAPAGLTGSIQLRNSDGTGFEAVPGLRAIDSDLHVPAKLNVTGAVDMASTLQVDGVGTFTAQSVHSAGATFNSAGLAACGAIAGGTTLALSDLASVASISMDDGSTLGPDSVADLWTFSAAGDTTQKDGAYDFDIASHDGSNGLKLGGVLVDASAGDLNYTNVATAGTAEASKALVVDANKDIGTIRNLTIDGTFSDGNYTFDTSGNVSGLGSVGCGAITSTGASTLGSISDVGAVTSTAAITAGTSFIIGSADLNEGDMEKLDGITNGTAAASKAVVLDASKNIATLGTVGCGAITSTGASTMGSLNVGGTLACDTSFTLDSVVIDADELGYLEEVTAGVAAASKAVVLDASKNIATLGTVGCGAITSTGASSFGSISYVGDVTVQDIAAAAWDDIPSFQIQGTDAGGNIANFRLMVSGGILRAAQGTG